MASVDSHREHTEKQFKIEQAALPGIGISTLCPTFVGLVGMILVGTGRGLQIRGAREC